MLALVGPDLSPSYFVYDGALGHNSGVQLVRQCGLHLISKLRYDSALYFPNKEPYSDRGYRKKYGDRLDYTQIPDHYRKSSVVKDNIQTDTYQMNLGHKKFTEILNVIIVVNTNLKTKKSSHIILFSTDLTLKCEQLGGILLASLPN